MPNDETEQDRLRILHQVYLYIFDRKLTTVELNNPTNILDIGTGTGDWAIGMGELYPNCDVVGTDISAIQPTAVPHNVYFEIDNAEMEWTRPPDTYDLIHFRNMVGAFSDWPFVYSQAFTCLKPGGYIEIVELDERAGLKDFYALLDQSSDTYRLIADTFIAAAKSGRPRGMAHAEPRLLMEAGFVDVRLQEFSVPLSVTDSMQACGKLWLVACLAAVEALSLRLVTRYMGWTPERARAACEDVISALRALALDTSGRAKDHIVKVRVLTGRKPDAFPGQESAQRIRPDGAIDHGLPSPHSRASSSEFDVQPPEVDENLLADGNGSGDVDMAGCASDASSVTPKGKEKALPEDNGPIGDGSTS